MREAPPVITMTNNNMHVLPDPRPSMFLAQENIRRVSKIIGEEMQIRLSCVTDTSGLDAAQDAVRKLHACLHASSMQVELRTPPSDWPCLPSPRLFGLVRGEW